MAAEVITLNITPTGDRPVLHLSQYDTGRPFGIEVLWGEDDYVLPEGVTAELRMRKTDSHLVTIAPSGSSDNVLEFDCIEQMCTCPGLNIGQLAILDENDNVVHSLTFDIEVQRDVMQGGLNSVSDIHNLTTQIQDIVDETMSEDYYTKTEVDDLIDSIPTFDPTNYYDKSDVNGLLADKADADDVYTKSEVYNKTETDNLLADKADKSDVYTKAQTDSLLFFKADKINDTSASDLPADIVTLTNAGNDCPLSALTVGVASGSSSVTITRCGANLLNNTGFFPITSTETFYYKSFSVMENSLPSIKIYAGITYTLSFDITSDITPFNISVGCGTGLYSADIAQVNGLSNGRVSITFTPTAAHLASGDILAFRAPRYTVNQTFTLTISNVKLELGSSATAYTVYNAQSETISIGSTISQDGTLDVITGLLTLEDESTIQCTGVEIDTKTGLNNIFCDTGKIFTLRYFGSNAEDLFRYIRLIKG